MMFPEYEAVKAKYNAAVLRYETVIRIKEEIFDRVLPNAVQFDKEKVCSSPVGNRFEDYVIEIDEKQIDDKLKEADRIVGEWANIMRARERDLRDSKHYLDVIYVLHELEYMNAYQIAESLHYSKSQIYRAFDKIDKIKKKGQNGTKWDNMRK